MRCYTSHKRIVRFLKVMNHMDNSVCIYPTSVVLGMCCEAKLSKPVYSEICKERFKFQFSVALKAVSCKIIENDDKISATGYSFRDKSDAIESAALAMLDLLMYRHGIRSTLYSEVAFIKDWPAYNHISENLKITSSSLLDISSELSSLIESIDTCGNLFEVQKSSFICDTEHPSETGVSAVPIAVLNDCYAELRSIYHYLYANIREHTEVLQWRCHSHRFYSRGYYEAVYNLHKDLDIKMECMDILKATLDKVCEKGGYSYQFLSSKCALENCYTAQVVLLKLSDSVEADKRYDISSVSYNNCHECQRDAIYRAIKAICGREGLKIIDAGYLDLRDMQKGTTDFKHEAPLLCDMVAKMKAIVQHGFKNIDILSQQYYRRLRDSRFPKEVRLSLADCISEFIHILKCFDEETKKMEIYSSNSASHGKDSGTR